MHTAILALMQSAEALFPGKSGKKKKEWVVEQAIQLKHKWGIDIPLLTGIAEDAILRIVLGIVIEVIWGLVFKTQTMPQ